MISQDRQNEADKNSWLVNDFEYWKSAVEDTMNVSRAHGYNSYKGTYSFSKNLNGDLKKLDIPILISYGTKDTATPFLDLFRLETIKEGRNNIVFKSYIGRGHNYFPLKNGKVDYSSFGWDRVANDWGEWLNNN